MAKSSKYTSTLVGVIKIILLEIAKIKKELIIAYINSLRVL